MMLLRSKNSVVDIWKLSLSPSLSSQRPADEQKVNFGGAAVVVVVETIQHKDGNTTILNFESKNFIVPSRPVAHSSSSRTYQPEKNIWRSGLSCFDRESRAKNADGEKKSNLKTKYSVMCLVDRDSVKDLPSPWRSDLYKLLCPSVLQNSVVRSTWAFYDKWAGRARV